MLERSTQALIFYSILSYYLEMEFTEGRPTEGWWLVSEWVVAVLFSMEYVFRWVTASNRRTHPYSHMAIIDLLAILPFFCSFAIDLRSLRLIRTLRVLQLLKLYRYSKALQNVLNGFRNVKHELAVVGFMVLMMAMFSSVAMYEFEHDAQPAKFGRLSDAIWWCIVTLTTVGYGDVYPVTWPGRIVAIMTMIVGIGIFGVFVSLIGGSFVATMKHEQALKHERDLIDRGYLPGHRADGPAHIEHVRADHAELHGTAKPHHASADVHASR